MPGSERVQLRRRADALRRGAAARALDTLEQVVRNRLEELTDEIRSRRDRIRSLGATLLGILALAFAADQVGDHLVWRTFAVVFVVCSLFVAGMIVAVHLRGSRRGP